MRLIFDYYMMAQISYESYVIYHIYDICKCCNPWPKDSGIDSETTPVAPPPDWTSPGDPVRLWNPWTNCCTEHGLVWVWTKKYMLFDLVTLGMNLDVKKYLKTCGNKHLNV